MKSIHIQYFAMLREKSGTEKEVIETNAQTYSELYLELSKRHDFDLSVSMIQVAVNDEFIDKNQNIVAGARVVFIPPVAGG